MARGCNERTAAKKSEPFISAIHCRASTTATPCPSPPHRLQGRQRLARRALHNDFVGTAVTARNLCVEQFEVDDIVIDDDDVDAPVTALPRTARHHCILADDDGGPGYPSDDPIEALKRLRPQR